MYDFKQYLKENEHILYEGRPVPGTGDKNISGLLFIILFMLIIQIIMVLSIIFKLGDGAYGISIDFIIIFGVTLFFDWIAIRGLYYNLFKKKRAVADDFYCITNKRVFKYELKNNKLVYGYLEDYKDIRSQNVKNGFGDLYMGISLEGQEENVTLKDIRDIIKNQDPENMPFITFESIKSPSKIAKIAKAARKQIIDN